MSQTAIERLEGLLNEKERELEELKEQLDDKLENVNEWMKHRRLPKGDEYPSLPVPRLQLRCAPLGKNNDGEDDWYNYMVVYEMVYQHYTGLMGHTREERAELIAVPFSYTRIGAGINRAPIYDGKIDLPRRDGIHIRFDAANLKLPMFIICGDVVQAIEPEELPLK